MGKRKTNFDESLLGNTATYGQYLRVLSELAVSMFEWRNVPDSIDVRYLEMQLFLTGMAVWFKDEELENQPQLCLSCLPSGNFDVYGYPTRRTAYSRYNGYNKTLSISDSVIIYNNFLRTPSVNDCMIYARRLYNLDRIIDVNANAQKTPILVRATEKQRLSLLNVYNEYDGNSPVIFGDNDLDPTALRAVTTSAPFVADKIYELKTQYWNEALTRLGISNINTQKKERMITDEVTRNQGGIVASRYSRLESRRTAANKINQMFGTNITVEYRQDYQIPEVDSVDKYVDNSGEVGDTGE
jgi:hypothetical protein